MLGTVRRRKAFIFRLRANKCNGYSEPVHISEFLAYRIAGIRCLQQGVNSSSSAVDLGNAALMSSLELVDGQPRPEAASDDPHWTASKRQHATAMLSTTVIHAIVGIDMQPLQHGQTVIRDNALELQAEIAVDIWPPRQCRQ